MAEKVKKTRKLEELENLKSKIKEKLKYEEGVITTDSPLYEENLPESLDIQTVKKVKNYDRDFIAASTQAVGELAVEKMAEDKTIDRIEAIIGLCDGYDSLDVAVEREREYVYDGKPYPKKGVTTTSYNVEAGRNVGVLKQARKAINDYADELLK